MSLFPVFWHQKRNKYLMLALNLVLHPFFHSLVRRSLSVSCLVFQEGSSLFLNCPLLLPYHSAPKIQKDGKYFCENRKSKLPVLFALSPENRGCRCKLNRKSDTVIYRALTDSFLKQNKKKFPMYDFGNISITSVANIQIYRKKNEAFAFGLHFLPKLCLEIKGFGQNAEEFKLHGAVHSLQKFGNYLNLVS